MADVFSLDPTNITLQSYSPKDENLISQFEVDMVLTGSSYIEFFVYDNNKTLLTSRYNYTSYVVLNNGLSAGNNNEINNFTINPGDDAERLGFTQGRYISYYNFLTKQVGDSNTQFFIQEISSDRTEIRLDSNSLSNLDIVEQTNNFIQFRDDSTYFVDFYLNFGSNNLIIANNIQLQNATTNDPTVLVKLYEPLPPQFELKDTLWVVTTLNKPQAFDINFQPQPIEFVDFINLSGPNFNIPIKDQVNNSSQNLSFTDLTSGAPISSLEQLNSLMDSGSLSISVDYTDFADFIHFSSAQTRLENFHYKVQLIEGYSSSIATLTNVTSSTTSTTILQSKISDITKNFDKYEYFLYYNSGSSYSWPKTTTEPPYLLSTANSAEVLTWFGSTNEQSSNYGHLILSASFYDNANKDQLLKAIPSYLREDSSNEQYELFVDMVAQYYDNVWLYTKDVTQKYNADNRLDFGVSKDLVSDAIKDFGVKLYQNNFSQNDLYTAFLGLTPDGALFPFPEITSSLPAPTGFEFVDTLISASNDIIPLDDANKSLYKRIYHNIPYLLKSKGTMAGLRALITSYGIPDTILRISEFGGKDKVNENDWDYYFNKFNYSWNTQGTNTLSTPWEINPLFNYTAEVPGTVELRFKINNFPQNPNVGFNASQSLWYTEENGVINKSLVLEYTGSYSTSSSLYEGSIKDPYYQYGTLKYIANPNTVNEVSCSVYLPFYDGEWWSVMVREDGFDTNVKYLGTEDYDFILTEDGNYLINDSSGIPTGLGTASLFAANKIYNGLDGTSIGYFSSDSLTDPTVSGSWLSGSTSYFAKGVTLGDTYDPFEGEIQEIRYYNVALGTTRFEDYVMNPLSIEGNSINSSPDELVFRASLGSELDTSNTLTGSSIHPKITGSWTPIPSFTSNSTYTFSDTASFTTNNEYYFLDQFPAGIKNRITDKIRYEDNVVPTGDTLSAFRRVTQQTEASASYTDNINYLEVAFSPQNEINDDIVSQLGYFNIGDYIGDPRQRSSSLDYYPDLNNLSKAYFEKYIKNYDLVDFVRLIKFFDNSLFKMIKDFIPARTSLASGIVIKQHLLERNKYPQPQVSYTNDLLTGSIDMVDVEGGPGGMMNLYNSVSTSPSGTLNQGPDNIFNLTQSWDETYPTLLGSVTKLNDSQHEFYDGEFSGSTMLITNGELNSGCDEFKNVSPLGYNYSCSFYLSMDSMIEKPDTYPLKPGVISFNNFTSGDVYPSDGEVYLLYDYGNQAYGDGNFSQGIKYIKISRIGGDGVNNTTPLENLTSLVIPFPDLGNILFSITDKVEYADYFYIQVEPTQLGTENVTLTNDLPSSRQILNGNSISLTGSGLSGNGFTDTTIDEGEYNSGIYTFSSSSRGYPVTIDFTLKLKSAAGSGNSEILFSPTEDSYLPLEYISQTFQVPNDNTFRLYSGSFTVFPPPTPLYNALSSPGNTSFTPNLGDYTYRDIVLDTVNNLPLTSASIAFQLENSGPETVTIGSGTDNIINYTRKAYASSQNLTYNYTSSYEIESSVTPGKYAPGQVFPALTSSFITIGLSNEEKRRAFSQPYNLIIPLTSSVGSLIPNTIITSSQGGLTFLKTPNVNLNISASTRWTNSGGFDTSNSVVYTSIWKNDTIVLESSGSLDIMGRIIPTLRGIINDIKQGDTLTLRLYGYANFTETGGIINTVDMYSLSGSIPLNAQSFLTINTQDGPEYTSEFPQLIFQPSFTQNFNNSDCNVLGGSIQGERPNPFLQDLDYQTSQTVPVNYTAVLNNTATKATVPESNYTQLSHTNLRYGGSKIQSQILNRWTTNDNIGTYGKTPSISVLDTNIYEFQWGSGTTPEILGWGVLKTGKILKVQSTKSVTTVNQSDGLISRIGVGSLVSDLSTVSNYRKIDGSPGVPGGVPPNTSTGSYNIPGDILHYVETPENVSDYYYILNGNLPVNTEISPTMYVAPTDGSNPILPKVTKIATTEFGVPSISTFAATSSRTDPYGYYSTSGGGFGFIQITSSFPSNLNTLETNSNGFYTDNGTDNEFQIQDIINTSLNKGERWFVTLFNSFEYPSGSEDWNQALLPSLASGSLTPYNVGYDILDEFNNYPNPLAYRGVHEIIGTQVFQGLQLILASPKRNSLGNVTTSQTQIGGNSPGNSLGLLIWKAEESLQKTQFVIVQDNVTGGVLEGAFTSRFSPQEITDNLESITQEFGSNKQ